MRFAQPFAAWLVERPQNTVFGLLASLVLPPTPYLGAAVMTFLLLHENQLNKVALYGAIAVLAMGALNALFGSSPLGIARLAALTWVPAAALALYLKRSQSLTLTVQVSVILLWCVGFALFFAQGDTNAAGQQIVAQVVEVLSASGYDDQAAQLEARQALVGWQVLSLIVLVLWSSFVLALITGNALLRSVAAGNGVHGSFDHLTLGRILAIIAALMCVAALLSDAAWLSSLAFVAFAVFWLQGLAFFHWLHAHRSLPKAVLIGLYVALPFLHLMLVTLLAVVGYLDAWFEFRKRLAARAT